MPAYGADAPQVVVTLGTDGVDEALHSHVLVKNRAQAGHRVGSHNDGPIMKVQVRPPVGFQLAGNQRNQKLELCLSWVILNFLPAVQLEMSLMQSLIAVILASMQITEHRWRVECKKSLVISKPVVARTT